MLKLFSKDCVKYTMYTFHTKCTIYNVQVTVDNTADPCYKTYILLYYC